MERYFLFANPSILEGMSRVLDLGNTLNTYNTSLSPEKADFAATKSDWEVVASDIRAAIQEQKEQSANNG